MQNRMHIPETFPHFKRVITRISLDIEHLYSSKLKKKKQQAPNNKLLDLPSTPWLVGAFISSTKKQLPFVATCTHQKTTKEGLPEDPSTATEEPESEETEAWSYVPVA